jgi:hypothetical protein
MPTDFAYERPSPELIQNAVGLLQKKLSRRGIGICVSGIDGSGKTTLAGSLVEILKNSGLPARRLHLYQWYVNIAVTPFVVFYNRYLGRKILVLDRGIFDNVAVMTIKFPCPPWLSDIMVALMCVCYPRVEYSFYLVASFTETLKRRPDTREHQFALLTKTYERMMARVRHDRLCSNEQSFNAALQCIAFGCKSR